MNNYDERVITGEQSYSEIKERDVDAIGKHCDVKSCHQLDFLPFKCESCLGTFCLDHRTETAHTCPHEGKWAAARRRREVGTPSPSPSSSSSSTGRTLGPSTCAHTQCKTTIHTARSAGVLCPYCKRTYCLPHRLQDSHNCSTLPPLLPPTAKVQATATAKGALAKFKAWTAGKSEKVGEKVREKRQGSTVVETLRLKREAKGDDKVPVDKRVWVYVEAEKGSTMSKLPRGEFFYSKDWSVGKVLDQAASALQVQNVNNRGDNDEQRLRIFHVEGGRVLSFSEKFGDTVMTGNTIVLLRGMMLPDLMVEV